jgi:hypothetical protein
MPILNIPSIGTELVLEEDWTFTLHSESRNDKFWQNYVRVHPEQPGIMNQEATKNEWGWIDRRKDHNIDVILPKGTVLKVSRIYIRNGLDRFDSITFTASKCPIKGVKGRFWVKLEDANTIRYVKG